MRIVLRMTGNTIPAGGLQGSQCGRPGMALGTLHTSMFARQFEIELVVIKIVPEPFHAIMTLQTVLTEQHLVFDHERHIHADVAHAAGQYVELGDILAMTISAQERFLLRRELVTV